MLFFGFSIIRIICALQYQFYRLLKNYQMKKLSDTRLFSELVPATNIKLSCLFILLITYLLISVRIFGDTTKPAKEIELWTPVQVLSCPEIQVASKNEWQYQDGLRRYRSRIDVDGDDKTRYYRCRG